jgi:hypothetical protein
MRNNYKRWALTFLLAAAVVFSGCKKILEQEHHSSLGPEFFSTPTGLEAGVTGCYAICRFFWGSEGFSYTQNAGTDEMEGRQGGLEFYTYTVVAGNGNLDGIWNNSYVAINNLNGVLKFGPASSLDPVRKTTLLGEAKFLRAFFYLQLVQTYGDVPLMVEFNDQPSTAASRTPIAEVYAAIIKDLTEAANELPVIAAGTSKGRASKAAAKHLLAKAYLTRGWSTATQAGDFTKAYEVANELITNRATYGVDLEQDFADVFKNGNEYGKESLFVLDRNTDRTFSESGYNNDASGVPDNGNKENRNNHFWVAFYTEPWNINSDGTASGNLPGASTNRRQLMNRDLVNGRPFRRYSPTNYTLNVAFAERNNDSRYSKTFQSVWITNIPSTASSTYQSTISDSIRSIRNGVSYTLRPNIDTMIWMPGREVTLAERQAFKGAIIAPSQYTSDWYPTMTKFLDPTRPHFNDPSDRPIILFRLAETYLIAAEAAFKDNKPNEAAQMLNALRRRAAYRTTNTAGQNTAAADAIAISAGNVTLDFILEERTRELFGEYVRWNDLVRTKTLLSRVQKYIIDPPVAAPGIAKRTINIKDFHVLRPIPTSSQIDLVSTPFNQNPGY